MARLPRGHHQGRAQLGDLAGSRSRLVLSARPVGLATLGLCFDPVRVLGVILRAHSYDASVVQAHQEQVHLHDPPPPRVDVAHSLVWLGGEFVEREQAPKRCRSPDSIGHPARVPEDGQPRVIGMPIVSGSGVAACARRVPHKSVSDPASKKTMPAGEAETVSTRSGISPIIARGTHSLACRSDGDRPRIALSCPTDMPLWAKTRMLWRGTPNGAKPGHIWRRGPT